MKPLADRPLAVLLLIGAVVIFTQSWLPTHDQDSLLFAVIARNMAESGDWVNLTYTRLYHQQFYEHPPLFVWLQAATFWLLGVSAFTMRLVNGLFGLLGLWAVYAYGARVGGGRVGFWAGFILLWSFKYFNYANKCRADVPLTALIAVGCYFVYRAVADRKYFIPAGVAAGMALMTKGPVGLAPVAVALLGFIALGEWKQLASRYALLGLLAMVLIPLPWVARQQLEAGTAFYQKYIVEQVIETAASGREKDEGGIFYYLLVVFKQYWPWLLALAPGVWLTVRSWRTKPGAALALVWALVILVGISLPAGKREYYLIPLAAPLAILSAVGLERCFPERWFPRTINALAILALAYALVGFTPVQVHKSDAAMMTVMAAAGRELAPDEILLAWEAPKKKWAVIAFSAFYARREAREIEGTELAARLENGGHLVLLTAAKQQPELDARVAPRRWSWTTAGDYALGELAP